MVKRIDRKEKYQVITGLAQFSRARLLQPRAGVAPEPRSPDWPAGK